jgi:Cyanate lyase C-terminal domain
MLSVMISGPRHREPAHYTAGPSAASLGSPPRPSAQSAAWKALIEEEFGDGIMSAIDFAMAIERLPNPKGDRVKITMSGKFLPYKCYGDAGNVPECGYREE